MLLEMLLEKARMTDDLEPDAELLQALGEVRDALLDEDRPEDDFYPAADQFLQVLHAQLVEQGRVDGELDVWDPRPALLDLEGRLIVNRSLDPELAATVKTIRDSLDAAGRALAAQN
jgi:hypothetical protein